MKTLKILIVTKKFFPHGDATSTVIGNIATALDELGHSVTVLALTSYKEDCSIKKWGNINLRIYYSKGNYTDGEFISCLRHKLLSSVPIGFSVLVSKIKKSIIPYYKMYSLKPLWIRDFKKALSDIILKEEYDICLTTLMPIEAVLASLNVCPAKTKNGVYQLDTYWNNGDLPDKNRDKRLELETRIAKESSIVLTTPQIYKTNMEIYPEIFSKAIPVEFPMIKKAEEYQNEKKDAKTHCVFLGTLYKGIRPPENVIRIIQELDLPDVVFDFYGDGQDLIRKLPEYEKAKNRIALHNAISTKEAETVRASADFLVNIDNMVENQVPSKIFEYISTGKPIINFYFKRNSPILEYLKKYPLCGNIYIGNDSDWVFAKKQLETFIHKYKGEYVDFKIIERVFKACTPKYVACQLIDECLRDQAV